MGGGSIGGGGGGGSSSVNVNGGTGGGGHFLRADDDDDDDSQNISNDFTDDDDDDHSENEYDSDELPDSDNALLNGLPLPVNGLQPYLCMYLLCPDHSSFHTPSFPFCTTSLPSLLKHFITHTCQKGSLKLLPKMMVHPFMFCSRNTFLLYV